MTQKYTIYTDLLKLIPAIPENSIISKSLFKDEQMDVTLFGFAAGQKLTEHTSPYDAMIQVLKGDLSLTLGGEELFVKEGCWVNMPPNLRHALEAKTEVVMLLTMVKE